MVEGNEIDVLGNPLDPFLELSLVVETGEGSWSCVLASAVCIGPDGEEINL